MIMNVSLPRSMPEAQGVVSSAILNTLDGWAAAGFNMHSMMLLRHGQVIAEGWWQPYAPEYKRYVYSLSKSFTSSAVGFAVAEGLLTVEDKVISFFAEDLPPTVSENLAAMRVKDLLTMNTGHEVDSTMPMVTAGAGNWVRGFLSLPVGRTPGTLFVYNSGATYMLSAIVQKLTGQTVLAYLTPRLFQPLGITDITWESCPMGINTGGWGLSIRTEDIAKFGQLYLQKGMWNGQQLLPAAWIEEATAAVVRNDGEGRDNDPTDWRQGYGYQFWRCQHNAYRGDGAFGQYCVVMPDQDAVLVITSDTSDMQGVLDLAWKYLLPAMQGHPLVADTAMQSQLQQRLVELALELPVKVTIPAQGLAVNGKTFRLVENRTGLKSAAFTFEADGCVLTLEDGFGSHTVQIGNGKWKSNFNRMAFMKPTMLLLGMGSEFLQDMKFAAAGTWTEEGAFTITLHYLETPHREYLTFRFTGDGLTMEVRNSMLAPENPMTAQMETVFRGRLA